MGQIISVPSISSHTTYNSYAFNDYRFAEQPVNSGDHEADNDIPLVVSFDDYATVTEASLKVGRPHSSLDGFTDNNPNDERSASSLSQSNTADFASQSTSKIVSVPARHAKSLSFMRKIIKPEDALQLIKGRTFRLSDLRYVTQLPLTSLEIHGAPLGDEGAVRLASVSTLKTLKINECNISSTGATALAKHTSLTTLHLAYNHIGGRGFAAFGNNPYITELDLSGNTCVHIGKALQALSGNLQLNRLGLQHVCATSDDAIRIASMANLQEIDLSDNQIDDVGFNALLANAALQKLHLAGNRIVGEESAAAVNSNITLRTLDLSANALSATVLAAIVNLPMLTTLHLNAVGCTSWPAAGNAPLTSLALAGNMLNSTSAQALSSYGNVIMLDLSFNLFDDEFSTLFINNPNLLSLNLAANLIHQGGAQTLIGKLPNLTDLNLCATSISDRFRQQSNLSVKPRIKASDSPEASAFNLRTPAQQAISSFHHLEIPDWQMSVAEKNRWPLPTLLQDAPPGIRPEL